MHYAIIYHFNQILSHIVVGTVSKCFIKPGGKIVNCNIHLLTIKGNGKFGGYHKQEVSCYNNGIIKV